MQWKFFKSLSLFGFFLGSALILPAACKPGLSDGETDTYIENGKLWAYGRVALTWLEGPGAIMLERQTPGQSLDTAGQSQYQLYGALLSTASATEGKRDIAWVDYHPSEDKLLAYAWSWEVNKRIVAGAQGQASSVERFDVYAVLRKAGRTRPGYTKLYIGSAVMAAGATQARVDIEPLLKLSMIGDGVYQGQWALHLPDARMVTPPNFNGFCSQKIVQLPGQNPSQMPGQNPNQRAGCRPLPAAIDLCKGTPTQAGCRPSSPVQKPVPSNAPAEVTGFVAVGDPQERVYEAESSGKIVFVSKEIASNDSDNAALCASRFYAVARTEGDQVNAACRIIAAPASAQDGKLTCAVTVEFDQPQTYLEKICNVTGLFSGSSDLPQTVQILHK